MTLMRAAKLEDPHQLIFPVLMCPMLDGVRCLVLNGTPLGADMETIPNRSINDILGGQPQFDGQLIVGKPTHADVFHRTSELVMDRNGFPRFIYWVFDLITNGEYPYSRRLKMAGEMARASNENIRQVTHKLAEDMKGFLDYEAKQLLAGYKGVMVRDPIAAYGKGTWTYEREGT